MYIPGGSVVKNPSVNAGDTGLVPGSGRSSGWGNGSPLQYSCLDNPMDRGAWWATVHRVTKSQTRTTKWLNMHPTHRLVRPRDTQATCFNSTLKYCLCHRLVTTTGVRESLVLPGIVAVTEAQAESCCRWPWVRWAGSSNRRRIECSFTRASGHVHFSMMPWKIRGKWVGLVFGKQTKKTNGLLFKTNELQKKQKNLNLFLNKKGILRKGPDPLYSAEPGLSP